MTRSYYRLRELELLEIRLVAQKIACSARATEAFDRLCRNPAMDPLEIDDLVEDQLHQERRLDRLEVCLGRLRAAVPELRWENEKTEEAT